MQKSESTLHELLQSRCRNHHSAICIAGVLRGKTVEVLQDALKFAAVRDESENLMLQNPFSEGGKLRNFVIFVGGRQNEGVHATWGILDVLGLLGST